ncbi:MAG: YabP/YqfC family sporulation protein [Clostridia bacterium]|nr:YabP/YqfC family sporulation protein [Clostridia bacterium]
MFFDELKLKLNLEDVVHFSVTILGRNAVVIEGVKNVVFSNENQLKARVKKCVVSVSGERLKIKEIGDGNILISGLINGVQYE